MIWLVSNSDIAFQLPFLWKGSIFQINASVIQKTAQHSSRLSSVLDQALEEMNILTFFVGFNLFLSS